MDELIPQLVANSPVLLGVLGFDGRLKYINPAWTMTLGWSKAELTTGAIAALCHPEDVRAVVNVFRKFQMGIELHDRVNFIARFRNKNGEFHKLHWTGVPTHQSQLIYIAARDVTDRESYRLKAITLEAQVEELGQEAVLRGARIAELEAQAARDLETMATLSTSEAAMRSRVTVLEARVAELETQTALDKAQRDRVAELETALETTLTASNAIITNLENRLAAAYTALGETNARVGELAIALAAANARVTELEFELAEEKKKPKKDK